MCLLKIVKLGQFWYLFKNKLIVFLRVKPFCPGKLTENVKQREKEAFLTFSLSSQKLVNLSTASCIYTANLAENTFQKNNISKQKKT